MDFSFFHPGDGELSWPIIGSVHYWTSYFFLSVRADFPRVTGSTLDGAEVVDSERCFSNLELQEKDLPDRSAPQDWPSIETFALTFNGYEHWGSFERCAEIARTENPETLTELRTKLFFIQRSWRHSDHWPDDRDMETINELLNRIRDKVRNGERE